MTRILIISAFCMLMSTSILAHGGHTAIESHIWHYMSSYDHLLIAVLGILAVFGVIWRKDLRRIAVRIGAQNGSQ